MRASRAVVAALVAALLLLTGCNGDGEDRPFSGHVLDHPYPVPDIALTDTDDQPFSLAEDTHKRLTLAFFGYVNCVDVCPAVLNHLASAMTRLDDKDRQQVDVVLITSDPTTDTPASMRKYLDQFDSSFIGLDGDLATIRKLGLALGVGVDDRDLGGHGTQVLGIDNGIEAPVYWDSDTSPAQFADDIHTLLNT